jgi:hypothetical protein
MAMVNRLLAALVLLLSPMGGCSSNAQSPDGGAGPADGAGGPGGDGPDGAAAASPADARAVRPDAPVDVGPPADTRAADVPALPDAPAPDLRLRSDVQVPDGGFRYPSPGGPLCGNARHTLARTPAELLVVLDRSGSMAEETTPGRTRWEDARDAVIAAVGNAANLAWGLKVFPSIVSVVAACVANPGVEVGVGFGHAGAIGAALAHAGPPAAPLASGTPTEQAIVAGGTYLQTVTTGLPKYMVLVTDGEPNCGDMGGVRLPEAALAATAKAMAAAAGAGIKTFVIGVSTSDLTANLNRLADAGGMPRALEPRYYPAENRADLDAALQAISVAITTCVFPLVTRPLDPDFVGVSVGSKRVPRDLDRLDGWDYVNQGTAIEIYGPACEALKTGAAQNADIQFGCPG